MCYLNFSKQSSHRSITEVEEERLNQLAINLYFFTGVLATAAFVARWSIEGFLYSRSLYLNFFILPTLMFGFPLIIKKTGKRIHVTAVFVILALAFLFVRIIHTGGAYSPMMAWLMPIPFLGFLLGTAMIGVLSVLLIVVLILLVSFPEVTGIPVTYLAQEQSVFAVIFTTVMFMIFYIIVEFNRFRRGYERKIKVMKSEIESMERMDALSFLTAGIAHEINNPLSIINGHVGRLKRNLGKKDESYILDSLERIENATSRVASIVYNVQSFSGPKMSEFELIEVGEFLSECVSEFEKDFLSLSINLVKPVEQCFVSGSAQQLKRLFGNLVQNAFDETKNLDTQELNINCFSSDYEIEIYFTDSGNGVDESEWKKIFHPFYTTKSPGEGVGLGLTICFSIAQAHQGNLYYKDKSFVLRLPLK